MKSPIKCVIFKKAPIKGVKIYGQAEHYRLQDESDYKQIFRVISPLGLGGHDGARTQLLRDFSCNGRARLPRDKRQDFRDKQRHFMHDMHRRHSSAAPHREFFEHTHEHLSIAEKI